MESDSSSDHDEVSKQRGPTIKRDVSKEKKEEVLQYILKHFVVNLKSRKNSLQSTGSKWRNFKHYLFKKFIEKYKNDPKPKFPPPEMYPFIEKADWNRFVSQRLSKKWQVKML
ncbi:hypothetical protein LXL04_024187 [Taraxacum kok-saghyz]